MITITLKTQPHDIHAYPREVIAALLMDAAEWVKQQPAPTNPMERERTFNLALTPAHEPLGIVTLTECLPDCLLYEGHDGECM